MGCRIAFVVLALAACSGPELSVAHTTGAEVSSLSTYATYTHQDAQYAPEGFAPGPLRAEVLDRVRRDVDAELGRRGYRVAADGQLVVRISTGARTIEKQPTGALAAAGASEIEQTEGGLVIDIFDRASGRSVFHGFAHGVVQGEEVEDEQLASAVSKILEPVPRSTR